MTGQIIGISGPTVRVALPGLKLYDQVRLGAVGLRGEVVRLERNRAVVQVYESTRGLAQGDPVVSTGSPLTVRLGPALLSRMFDGLQRPLVEMAAAGGAFITPEQATVPFTAPHQFDFTPLKQTGEELRPGEVFGQVIEGGRPHLVQAGAVGGEIVHISAGQVVGDAAVLELRDGTSLQLFHDWPVRQPRPVARKRAPSAPLVTGQRCVDFLFPLARGGTAILPGGFGTGKTILEQAIAKFADVDLVVYVGCGERGNEMADMLDEFRSLEDPWSQQPLMQRTVVVVNTSNMPVAAREASIYTGVAMAEYYRDMGYHVLLLADSLSRWAEALREISSALEEMPGEEGYPTYLASRLAGFFARAGVVETLDGRCGSLSMILSVSPPGGDITEPVSQACLRATGSFLMLDTALAQRRQFPAINWFQSFSLYSDEAARHFSRQVDPRWKELRRECRSLLQQEESLREVAEIVGTEGLQDEDRLLMTVAEQLRHDFLAQNAYSDDAFSAPEQTLACIAAILDRYRRARQQLHNGKGLDELLKELRHATG